MVDDEISPAPKMSRVWKVTLKTGERMTMACGDETLITQDEAIALARQRFFDAVLTVE